MPNGVGILSSPWTGYEKLVGKPCGRPVKALFHHAMMPREWDDLNRR